MFRCSGAEQALYGAGYGGTLTVEASVWNLAGPNMQQLDTVSQLCFVLHILSKEVSVAYFQDHPKSQET